MTAVELPTSLRISAEQAQHLAELERVWKRPAGLYGWLTSTDHKEIGLRFIKTAFIGFGVWVHHMFATPLPDLGQGLFTASSLMIVISAGLQMFCWIATPIWAGWHWMCLTCRKRCSGRARRCGNTLLMLIESTTLLLLVVSYFYVRQNFDTWPPPNPHALPTIYRPFPDLAIPTAELLVPLASCGLMFWTNRSARNLQPKATKIGLWLLLLLALGVIAARFADFKGTHVRWNDNAYASLVWVILGTHLTYVLAAAAEFFIMVLYIHRHPLDDHQAHDINLTGIYWYWVVGTWLVVYVLVYWGARWL